MTAGERSSRRRLYTHSADPVLDEASMTQAAGQGSDVVVIGGGIRGLSISYYLARSGVGVTLVEKGFLGSGASSANAGLVNVSQKAPGHYTLWSLLSAE